MVEQLFCKHQVTSSILVAGTSASSGNARKSLIFPIKSDTLAEPISAEIRPFPTVSEPF
jgi:hypothetical protein